MKQIKSLLLIGALCTVLLGGCGQKAENTVSVTDGKVKQGEEVTVYLRATGELPVAAYGFNVYYNTDELTFKECKKASDFEKKWKGMEVSNDTEADEGKHCVIFAGVNTNKGEALYEGDLYSITFTATGKAGTKAELTLDVSALEDLEGKDYLEEFAVENGVIEIQ